MKSCNTDAFNFGESFLKIAQDIESVFKKNNGGGGGICNRIQDPR
ncbi:hypothetical protein A2U01_0068225, partial [Trifolium medium]|nr:hypothetical protein [Trifolium medium]